MSHQQVQLKVVESYTRDVGRGEARLDYVTNGHTKHFQEAAKKVRSSRESNPMEKVSAPYYR